MELFLFGLFLVFLGYLAFNAVHRSEIICNKCRGRGPTLDKRSHNKSHDGVGPKKKSRRPSKTDSL